MDVDKKIIIVDEYDLIKKERWESFWNESKDKIGHLILFCGIDWNLNIKKKTLEELSKDSFLQFKICPFYYSKREDLIRKICNIHLLNKYEIDEKVKKINEHIANEIKYFQLNPSFIQQFVEYYINFPNINNTQMNVFSKVFEGNISFRIKKNSNYEDISEVMVALDYIAYNIHFNKKYPISLKDFIESINKYNEEYDNNLKFNNIYSIAKKSNIIRDIDCNGKEGIEFCDKNLLAYFVASHLNRSFNEDLNLDKIQYILDNICFPPNGDIILFLSYITSNIKILIPVIESIIKHMESWEELDFDKCNINYLSNIQFNSEFKIPTEEDKKYIKDKKDKIEKQIIEKDNKECKNLYSYDENKKDSFENQIKKSISYLELIAKILPNFRHILKPEQKKIIIKILYTYPNKLLYFILKDIDNNYKNIINELLENVSKIKTTKIITEKIIANEIQNQSIFYIIGIYDFIANIVTSNNKTILELNNKDKYFDYDKNINYSIQNIMIEENLGNFLEMSNKSKKLYKRLKLDMYKKILKLIIIKYFTCHNIKIDGEVQSTIDFFFNDNQTTKKEIKMLQAKNRLKKR